jgi:hypothetical protein
MEEAEDPLLSAPLATLTLEMSEEGTPKPSLPIQAVVVVPAIAWPVDITFPPQVMGLGSGMVGSNLLGSFLLSQYRAHSTPASATKKAACESLPEDANCVLLTAIFVTAKVMKSIMDIMVTAINRVMPPEELCIKKIFILFIISNQTKAFSL